MKRDTPSASIALLTYNGARYLKQVLEMITRQKFQPFEVIAIDSGSTDSTMDILQQFRVSTRTISHSDFRHSATRNMAAEMCSGEYVVFLTQDAVPADSCWLDRLLRPFQTHENVAGTYSRQIPRPDANPLEANDVRQVFRDQFLIQTIPANSTLSRPEIWKLISFSNTSAAYDRKLLLENPFAANLEVAEDQEWAYRMLKQSYSIVYEPDSVVLHSHEHTLEEKYARSLSMGKSFSQFMYPISGRRSVLLETGACLVHVLRDFRYISSCKDRTKSKIKWLARSPIHRAVTHYAFRKGFNAVGGENREVKQDQQASLKT